MYDRSKMRMIIITAATIGLAMITLIAIGIATSMQRAGKITVTISVLPADALITIDGKPSGAAAYVTPGPHTFTAKKSGFKDATATLQISDTLNTVTLLPAPDSPAARTWASETANRTQLEEMGAAAASERGSSLQSQYPLIAKLPHTEINGPFAIDYGYAGEDSTQIYFIIHDSTPDGRVNALRWIRDQGIDPTDLDIRYDEYINPLTSAGSQS